MYLRLCQGRIDQHSRIVTVDQIQYFDFAQSDIHLDLGDRTAQRIGGGIDETGALGGEVVAVGPIVQDIFGKRAEIHHLKTVGDTHNLSVSDIQIGSRDPDQFFGAIEDQRLQLQTCTADREAGRMGLTGGVCPRAEGADIGILKGQDVYPVKRYADSVGSHLTKDRIRALPDLRFAQLQLKRAILIQRHAAGGGLEHDRRNARVKPENRRADAAPEIAGLIPVFPALLHIVGYLHRPIQALLEGIVIQCLPGNRIPVADRHQAAAPDFQRLHPQCSGNIIHMAFHRPGDLRDSVAPHGARHRLVREDGPGIDLHVRTGIKLAKGRDGRSGDGVAV